MKEDHDPHEHAHAPASVPSQVFSKFLDALRDKEVSVEVQDRLRRILLTERTLSDRALREAVLGEDSDR